MAHVKYLFVLLFLCSINGVYLNVVTEAPKDDNKSKDSSVDTIENKNENQYVDTKDEQTVVDGTTEDETVKDDSDVQELDANDENNEFVSDQVNPEVEKKNEYTADVENRVDSEPGFDSVYDPELEDPLERPLEADVEFGMKLSMAQNVSEICQYLDLENCEETLQKETGATTTNEHGDKVAVSGVDRRSLKLGKFAMCNPRLQAIALPRPRDHSVVSFPACTMAMRCGGCCTSEMFSCEPTEERETILKVFDTKLPYPGAHRFFYLGMRNVAITEHTQCDARCKTKKEECHPNQIYEVRQCRCACSKERKMLKSTCTKEQIWDKNECDCICPNRATTVCPPPSTFNKKKCECTLKTGASGEINLDKLLEKLREGGLLDDDLGFDKDADYFLDEMLGVGKGDKDTPIANPTEAPTTSTTSTAPPTTTTTTKTTTTTPKPPENPCAAVRCFGSWKARLLANGRCQCMPPFPFHG